MYFVLFCIYLRYVCALLLHICVCVLAINIIIADAILSAFIVIECVNNYKSTLIIIVVFIHVIFKCICGFILTIFSYRCRT